MGESVLHLGDCIKFMETLEDKSVDGIFTDLPYGTTQCNWDVVIPLKPMWKQVKRILKLHGVFITTATQPFVSILVCSNLEWFKYDWIWDKVNRITNFPNAEKQPLRRHEHILVFSKNNVYNPIMKPGTTYKKTGSFNSRTLGKMKDKKGKVYTERYPHSIIRIKGNTGIPVQHPTQKPLALYEYLVRTYANKGDTVLDFCMGSGTTGEATVKNGRRFIGCEKDKKYFEIAKRRIENTKEAFNIFDLVKENENDAS